VSGENKVSPLETDRLEAFSDGVVAIIITIMVLEFHAPEGDHNTFAVLYDLRSTFLSYVLSFVYIGIYWNNHHHMLRITRRMNGAVMWANLHLLFWLSLVPFATAWMGNTFFAPVPTALYGVLLLMAAIAYTILQRTIIASDGSDSPVALATGSDLKGKLSIALYAAGVGLAFVDRRISGALYVVVALMWLVPDRRMVRTAGE
jgi:uncharacterized membrane protein